MSSLRLEIKIAEGDEYYMCSKRIVGGICGFRFYAIPANEAG